VQLQQSLHYSALEAGAAMLPVTVLLLVLSPPMGALAQRIGPRLPMTAGPVVAAAGLALMARITPGASYPAAVLPAVTVFGLGLSVTVAPLTSAVLTALSQDQAGLASGTNNAIARTAGLFAVAVLPLAAGVSSATGQLGAGFSRAMLIAAGVCAAGGLIAWVTVTLFPSRAAGWLVARVGAPLPECGRGAGFGGARDAVVRRISPTARWRSCRQPRCRWPGSPSPGPRPSRPSSAPPSR